MNSRYYQIPLIIIAVVAAGFGLSLVFQDQSPIIKAIDPRVGNPGEVMVIDGSFFGSDRSRAWVSIAGERVTSSNILEWTPQRISFRIPDQAKSGGVAVQTSAGKSKERSFTNQNQIPRIVQSVPSSIDAYITRLSPQSLSLGDPVVIQGRNFGGSQGGVEVLIDDIPLPSSDIFSWAPREIGFWMPMYAHQGKVQLRLGDGLSNVETFNLTPNGGELQTVGDPVVYRISLLYEIRDIESNQNVPWGSVTAYLPKPPQGLGQIVSDEHLGTSYPAVEVPPGMLAFTVSKFEGDQTYRLGADWAVEKRQVRLRIDTDPVLGYDNFKELRDRYTAPSTLVPTADKALRDFVNKAVGTEAKPLAKARLIYKAVLQALQYDQGSGLSYASQVLADGKANAFGYADLLAGAWRSAGIPARLVEGIFISRDNRPQSHFWAECFVPGIGWIPVDAAMGDGLYSNELTNATLASDFYFGNMDERHVALIAGEGMTSLARIDANIQKLFQRFVLMQVHAESAGSVESFGLFIDTPGVRRLR